MTKRLIFILFSFIVLFTSSRVYAADLYTKNIGFESGSFTGWTSILNYFNPNNSSYRIINQEFPFPNPRMQIMNDTTAYDPYSGGVLKVIPAGYKYSARLGDTYASYWTQHLQYTLKVDSFNTHLVVKFAGVFRFSPIKYPIPDPGLQNFSFGDNTVCGSTIIFEQLKKNDKPWHIDYGANIQWCDWTTAGFSLSDFIGQTVTLDFMSSDSPFNNYSFGYIYFIAETHPMIITVKYCANDKYATLTAPEGFRQYTWYLGNTVVGNGQAIVINNPVVGTRYVCVVNSWTNPAVGPCQEYLDAVIPNNEPITADFTHQLIDCKHLTDTVYFTNIQKDKHRWFKYLWNFGDGATSTEENPSHIYHSSGIHQVNLTVIATPTLCSTTVSKTVETFNALYVGISGDSTYCSGYSTMLKGYGAQRYKWSNGSTADSIQVGKDTTVWMIGYSSTGCSSDTIRFKVKKEPDWSFATDGKESFCQGDYTVLFVSGGAYYRWNTGAKTSSITVRTPGEYTVIASNLRGCEKSRTFNVVEYPKPDVNFSMSTNTINSRHNEMICTVPFESGVQYSWDMGDGLTETGSTIHHIYDNTVDMLGFNSIVLKAINQQGCTDTISKKFEVTPFFPNIFSPNEDGVNDVFMAGYDLHIFDRNGILIYKGTSGWDGKYKGIKAGNDTYFYVVNYLDKNLLTQTRKGYIILKL